MIRQATEYDLNAIYELCLEAHQNCPYSHVEHDEVETKRLFAKIIFTQFAWVTEDLNGVLLACFQPLWFNPEKIGATDLVFYIRPESRGAGGALVRKYIEWADEADMISLSISFGEEIERVEAFYRRLGFERIGGKFLFRG